MKTSGALTVALVVGLILGGAGVYLFHERESKNLSLKSPRSFEQLINQEFSEPEIKMEENGTVVSYILNIKGLDKDTLKVDVTRGIVSVFASGHVIQAQEEGQASSQEETYRSYSRSFSIPSDVDESQVKFDTSGDKLIIQFPRK